MDENSITSVVKKLRMFEAHIDFPLSSEAEVHNFICLLQFDYPSLFHIGDIKYVFDLKKKNVSLFPEYLLSSKDYSDYFKQILPKLNEVRNSLNKYMTDIEKEEVIHNYICKEIVYQDEGPLSHTFVGPLLFQKGVCDGIAKLAHTLFHLVGIKSHVISGVAKSGENKGYDPHAWNVVQIGENWYNLDVTFDNSLSKFGKIRYDYFNVASDDIRFDHRASNEHIIYYKRCIDRMDFFISNSLLFDKNSVKYHIQNIITRKEKFLYFRIIGEYKEIDKIEIEKEIESQLKRTTSSYSVSRNINKARNVFYYEVSYGLSVTNKVSNIIKMFNGVRK